VFHPFDDEHFSNGSWAQPGAAEGFRHLAVREDFGALPSAYPTSPWSATGAGRSTWREETRSFSPGRAVLCWRRTGLPVGLAGMELVHRGSSTALAFRGGELLVGSRRGYYGVDAETGRQTLPLQEKVPVAEVTCLAATTNGVWVGTPRGVYFQANQGGIRYFASKRWLPDDEVLDLAPDALGDLYVLTRGGLAKIEFVSLTLADKAAYFDRTTRDRHIGYGFCAELRLKTAGDITTVR
jgi:hypothetical protein